jgi:hypothetical protein
MNSSKRTLQIVLAGIAALALVEAAVFVLRSGPRPVCHKALAGAFQEWMIETGHTNTYPNTGGAGSNSLAMMQRYLGPDIQQYGYVPGLSLDDSRDLVLMYLNTRYTWHGDTAHTIFSPRRWLVLSPDITTGTGPEGGQFLSTSEFKKRLQMTVEFLRDQQRPYWQVVAREQSNFLTSIKD